MILLSKREGGEAGWGGEAGKWTDGSSDIQWSGFIHRSEYFVTACLSRGHGLKSRRVLWMPSVCLNGPERTLQFVEVSIKMRHERVKNIPTEDLCTDG